MIGGFKLESHAVGRNPAPPGMCKTLVNSGIKYQPQLVSRISEPSTVWECKINPWRFNFVDGGIGHDVDLALVRVDDERLLAYIAGATTTIQWGDSDDGLILITKGLFLWDFVSWWFQSNVKSYLSWWAMGCLQQSSLRTVAVSKKRVSTRTRKGPGKRTLFSSHVCGLRFKSNPCHHFRFFRWIMDITSVTYLPRNLRPRKPIQNPAWISSSSGFWCHPNPLLPVTFSDAAFAELYSEVRAVAWRNRGCPGEWSSKWRQVCMVWMVGYDSS